MPVKYSRLKPNQISTIIKLRNICKSYSFIAQELNINKSLNMLKVLFSANINHPGTIVIIFYHIKKIISIYHY